MLFGELLNQLNSHGIFAYIHTCIFLFNQVHHLPFLSSSTQYEITSFCFNYSACTLNSTSLISSSYFSHNFISIYIFLEMAVPEVDKQMLRELELMGFPTARATRALHFSGQLEKKHCFVALFCISFIKLDMMLRYPFLW